MQARLSDVLGLHRTSSRASTDSFAGSINTRKAYKKFCKNLFQVGVTSEMIKQKEKEILDIFNTQNTTSSQIDGGGIADQSQILGVSDYFRGETLLIEIYLTENKEQSRFPRFRPPIDFIVGPLMLSAASAGDTKRLISILEYIRNLDFNLGIDGNQTALHKAAREGHKDIVQLLLEKGASIEAIDAAKLNPLGIAALNGHNGVVELLLEKGALIEPMGCNPLLCAAQADHTSTVELLLTKGASIEAETFGGCTPLYVAAWEGHISIVELLLAKGASTEGKGDRIPLGTAAQQGHTRIVELLLTNGASIGSLDGDGDTPLHCAAWSGHTSIVELLLGEGASIQAINYSGDTPLEYATRRGHTDTAKLLKTRAAALENRA